MTHSSPSLTATVCTPPTSEPAKASEMAKQMYFFPSKTSGTTFSWSAGEPKLRCRNKEPEEAKVGGSIEKASNEGKKKRGGNVEKEEERGKRTP